MDDQYDTEIEDEWYDADYAHGFYFDPVFDLTDEDDFDEDRPY